MARDKIAKTRAGNCPSNETRIGNTNECAFDLYCKPKSTQGNLIVSLHSITTTFGMAYGGARGATEKEIATVLRFTYPPLGFHVALRQLSDLQPGADFSGMDGTDDGIPWISFVAHKAFIYVDEFGTMAAAGTGMGFTVGMPARFTATRPFIFVIRDRETGTILFLGRVLDPSVH